MILRRLARRHSLAGLPALGTERLRIAQLVPGDAEAVRDLTDDPAITGAIDFLPQPFTLADAEGLVRSGAHGRDVFLGARERTTSGLVGVVGAHLRAERSVEIGFWIGGAARGRGYASEAVAAVVALLGRRLPRRAIVAECRPENVASWGLLRTLGFRDTGEEGHRPGRRVLALRRG